MHSCHTDLLDSQPNRISQAVLADSRLSFTSLRWVRVIEEDLRRLYAVHALHLLQVVSGVRVGSGGVAAFDRGQKGV